MYKKFLLRSQTNPLKLTPGKIEPEEELTQLMKKIKRKRTLR